MDVVVPFRGSAAELSEVRRRMGHLDLHDGDSLVVVDQHPGPPGYVRNRGAEAGRAEWLVFLDADVDPPADLLDRYFELAPGERTAMIAGGVVDEPVPPGAPAAARYAHLRGLMGQDNTFSWGDWSFAQTSNAACRREAFEAVGGFREDIRTAEDADLNYRLKAAGWEIERREEARVVHLSRQTMRGFVHQQLLHGAGGAWLDRRYPGSVPRKRRPGLVWWALRYTTKGLAKAAWNRNRDQAIWAVFDALENLAYEFGRSLRNERRGST